MRVEDERNPGTGVQCRGQMQWQQIKRLSGRVRKKNIASVAPMKKSKPGAAHSLFCTVARQGYACGLPDKVLHVAQLSSGAGVSIKEGLVVGFLVLGGAELMMAILWPRLA